MRYLTSQSRATTLGLVLLSFLIFPALVAAHTVGLSWDASTSQDVVGYNVYRGPSSNGPYTKINTTLDQLTSYSDSTVQGGQTYFYVTTAVDSMGNESEYSNQTQAVIPGGGSGSESALYSFSGGADPKFPYAGLIFDKAGNLYGTTQLGGASNQGTVFEMTHNPDGTWSDTILYSFTGGADGGQPSGGLVFDPSGNLYGTTNFGGSSNCNLGCGTVFKLVPASGGWSETVLYTFTGGSDGREPYARLLLDASGNLYGTTLLGGNVNSVCSTGCGTVFKLTRTSSGWTQSVPYAFAAGKDGASPYAALASDSAGNLYGTTYGGGAYGSGIVFKLSPGSSGWTESVLYAFRGTRDGKYSFGDVILDATGKIYGTAFQGGGQGYGVVFQLAPNSKGGWNERVIHSFANSPSANPVAGVVFDPAGNLYGTTLAGGSQSSCGTACGTLFKLSPASGGWTYKVIHVFGQGADGYHPSGDLVLDPSGNMYGTTQAGGAQGSGLVFEIMH